MDAAEQQQQQQCQQDFLLRSRSQRLGHAAFPYSPTGSLPGSPSAASKCLSILLQQQHNDNQRYCHLQLQQASGTRSTQEFQLFPPLVRLQSGSRADARRRRRRRVTQVHWPAAPGPR
jgi:hypothetical protein